MGFTISVDGMGVNYQCTRFIGNPFRRKCKDATIEKCKRCSWCRAEMLAADATRLIRSFEAHMGECRRCADGDQDVE